MKNSIVFCLLSFVLSLSAAPAQNAAQRFAAACREANADVDKAVKAAREARKASAEKPFFHELKGGAATYGLYTVKNRIDAEPPVDLTAAYAKVRAALPEKLSCADEIALAKAEFELEMRGGSYAGRERALAKLTANPTDAAAAEAAVACYRKMQAHAERLAYLDRVVAANRGKNAKLHAQALGWRCLAAKDLGDGEAIAETKKLVEALPLTVENVNATYLAAGDLCDRATVERLLKACDADPKLVPIRHLVRGRLTDSIVASGDPAAIRRELEERGKTSPWLYARVASKMYADRCWKDAAAYAAKAVELDPKSERSRMILVQALLGAGRRAEAAEAARAYGAREKATAQERFTARVLEAFATAATPEDLTKALAALATAGDTGAKNHEEAVSWLMAASAKAFYPLMSSERAAWMLAARKAYFALMHDEIRVEYTVRYRASAPRTAALADAEGLFDPGWFADYEVEDRFSNPRQYNWGERSGVLQNLKTKPKPDLAAVKGEGRSAGLVVCYDETGVHLYQRYEDPSAAKFRLGEAGPVQCELSIMPGESGAWDQVFPKTDVVGESGPLQWDSIGYGHRLTDGSIVTDSTTTDTAFLFHTFVPWTHVYTRLPADGSVWRVVLCAYLPSGSFVVGGGNVHELGRGMKLVFDMDGEKREIVRRALVRRAAGDYLRFKAQWKNIDMWGDDILGDPGFYAASVKPWQERVGKAAVEALGLEDGALSGETLTKAEANLRDWLDPLLRLNDLRVAWLDKGFFGE